MLKRKIASEIKCHLLKENAPILLLKGARQVGKTFIIREVGKKLFKNFIEVNLIEDSARDRLFSDVSTVKEFYLALSLVAGEKMGRKKETLVFLDEIQAYPQLLTLLKFLKDDDRFTYVCSGSLLGVTLTKTSSIPIGSIQTLEMRGLDFEEFAWANGVSDEAFVFLREAFHHGKTIPKALHLKMMRLLREYLLCGGLPAVVQLYVDETNLYSVRKLQTEISSMYADDASKYDRKGKLRIKRIFEMIPSTLANKIKRFVIKEIDNRAHISYNRYEDAFDYLIDSGVALEVRAISDPHFPLTASVGKNLFKLFLNDVGRLTNVLFATNAKAVLDDTLSVNLGAVYENFVAQELSAHGHRLFYYDNKSKGEVDFLLDDYESGSSVPIEVKSGRDYKLHSAIDKFLENPDYGVKKAMVFSNDEKIQTEGKITYFPIYMISFL